MFSLKILMMVCFFFFIGPWSCQPLLNYCRPFISVLSKGDVYLSYLRSLRTLSLHRLLCRPLRRTPSGKFLHSFLAVLLSSILDFNEIRGQSIPAVEMRFLKHVAGLQRKWIYKAGTPVMSIYYEYTG